MRTHIALPSTLVLLVLVAAAGWQSSQSPQLRNAASNAAKNRQLEPGEIDREKSRVYVHVGKSGLGHEHAVVGLIKSGQVHLGMNRDAGTITFDTTSFTADTPDARRYIGLAGETARATQQKVTANMCGADVLNTAKYPTATFNIKSARLLDRKQGDTAAKYELDGEFTLHGVTNPVRLVAQAESQNGLIHLTGRFAIRQTDYGIEPYSTALGAIGVANELVIWGSVWVAQESVQK